jgi:putative addiction module component (TIGR02574 family)
MTNQEMLSQIRSLPADEQFQLATTILDDLAVGGQLPVLDAVAAELKRRLKDHRANPESGQSWEEVRSELFGKE